MAVFGTLSTLKSQLAGSPRLDRVWAYLNECMADQGAARARLMALAEGVETRFELGDGIFAMEQAYLTKDPAVARFESHRVYVDIQLPVEGEEKMQVADVRLLKVHEDFTPGRDVLFYHEFDQPSELRIVAGEAAVFFPVDGHKPSLRIAGPKRVRKTVVKIPVALFEA